jgi:hypothetical protein
VEHVRVLERLVLAFGDGQHEDLVCFTQVERRRAHEVADVLDHYHTAAGGRQPLQRVAGHVCIEMTALARVDLHCFGAGGPDALGVVAGLLVALDHADRQPPAQRLDCPGQQRGLARAGTGDQIQRKDAVCGEVPAGTGAILRASSARRRA